MQNGIKVQAGVGSRRRRTGFPDPALRRAKPKKAGITGAFGSLRPFKPRWRRLKPVRRRKLPGGRRFVPVRRHGAGVPANEDRPRMDTKKNTKKEGDARVGLSMSGRGGCAGRDGKHRGWRRECQHKCDFICLLMIECVREERRLRGCDKFFAWLRRHEKHWHGQVYRGDQIMVDQPKAGLNATSLRTSVDRFALSVGSHAFASPQ